MSANFKSVVTALCNCFVPKSGGEVSDKLIYGVRASASSFANKASQIDIQDLIFSASSVQTKTWTAPYDGWLFVYADADVNYLVLSTPTIALSLAPTGFIGVYGYIFLEKGVKVTVRTATVTQATFWKTNIN